MAFRSTPITIVIPCKLLDMNVKQEWKIILNTNAQAQVMITGSGESAPHQALQSVGSLLGILLLPLPLPTCTQSLAGK